MYTAIHYTTTTTQIHPTSIFCTFHPFVPIFPTCFLVSIQHGIVFCSLLHPLNTSSSPSLSSRHYSAAIANWVASQFHLQPSKLIHLISNPQSKLFTSKSRVLARSSSCNSLCDQQPCFGTAQPRHTPRIRSKASTPTNDPTTIGTQAVN